MTIINKKFDFFFIKFPIIFPIVYFLALISFPNYENLIILTTIFLLAEPHFGATWPFFFHKSNKNYIIEQKIKLIYFPLLIILFCLLGFFYFKSTFLLIFFAANIFHVTRQSFGILKLYAENKKSTDVFENIMYSFNALFFLVGFFRFYIPIIPSNYTYTLSIVFGVIILLVMLFVFVKFKSFNDLITLFTGSIVFYPICFVENPVHAILMGVTMHYSQYLALTFKVTKEREIKEITSSDKLFKKFNTKFLIYLFIYSLCLTYISATGKSETLGNIILIGITLQMLHFYIDSQLWKFSIKHNRDNVLNYLVHK